MEYVLTDAERVFEFLVRYFTGLGQTSLFVHGAIGLIAAIIIYILAYRFHVRMMLNNGVTAIWLMQGIYLVLVIGALTGIPYQWARFEARLANPGQTLFLLFVALPLIVGITMLVAASRARSSTKIEREHRRGQTPPPV